MNEHNLYLFAQELSLHEIVEQREAVIKDFNLGLFSIFYSARCIDRFHGVSNVKVSMTSVMRIVLILVTKA